MHFRTNQAILLGTIITLSSCGKDRGADETTTGLPFSKEHGSIVLIDPETGKPIKTTPCAATPEKEQASLPVCEIFREKFRTESINVLTIVESIKPEKTNPHEIITCCTTVIELDGGAGQDCYTTRRHTCRDDYERVP